MDVRFGSGTDMAVRPSNVRFASKADIAKRDCHVRFVPDADIRLVIQSFVSCRE
jgi:hypothetical protein